MSYFYSSCLHVCEHTCYYHAPPSHHYLLLWGAAVRQGDAFADEALVGALVLVEDLLDRQATFKHLHLFLPLQRHLEPLLSSQDLLLQRRLQFLHTEGGERTFEYFHFC